MTEKRAKKILKRWIEPDNGLFCLGQYVAWPISGDKKQACLDSSFTADELEAIAWWMRNK